MKNKTTSLHGRSVTHFLAKHGADVTGVIAGYVGGLTNRVCTASQAFAARHGRPMRCLESCVERKDQLARDLAARDRIAEDLIGVFRILAEHECRPSGSLRSDARR